MKMQMTGVVAMGLMIAAGAASAQQQSPTMDQDKQFVTQASQGDYTEITFSQLAQQKSTNPKVKAFASKMIADHQKLEAEMKPEADKLGVAPATALDAEHQQSYDQLSKLSGPEFDKQYMAAMDTDHHKTLDAFKAEEASTQDAQLKPIVKKGEKVVAQHTMMADKMQKAMAGTTGM